MRYHIIIVQILYDIFHYAELLFIYELKTSYRKLYKTEIKVSAMVLLSVFIKSRDVK